MRKVITVVASPLSEYGSAGYANVFTQSFQRVAASPAAMTRPNASVGRTTLWAEDGSDNLGPVTAQSNLES